MYCYGLGEVMSRVDIMEFGSFKSGTLLEQRYSLSTTSAWSLSTVMSGATHLKPTLTLICTPRFQTVTQACGTTHDWSLMQSWITWLLEETHYFSAQLTSSIRVVFKCSSYRSRVMWIIGRPGWWWRRGKRCSGKTRIPSWCNSTLLNHRAISRYDKALFNHRATQGLYL